VAFTVAQNRDAVGERQNFRKPVADVDDGSALGGYVPQDAAEFLYAGEVEAGGWLVEQENPGLSGERLDDLEELPVGRRQLADERVGIYAEVIGGKLPRRPAAGRRHGGRVEGGEHEVVCDVIAGCDGFHGVSRPSIPAGVLRATERDYPFGWLGILADVAPSSEELVYAHHERGFALLSLRSPTLSRLYVQVRHDEDIAEWSDDRIWSELQERLGLGGWTLDEGPVLEKGVTGMRSLVAEPMRYGHLYLTGDAAHIVPPTGAKGLNLAISDVFYLARAFGAHFSKGDDRHLESYSDMALRRVWASERFSWWLTKLLHVFPDDDAFETRVKLSEFDHLLRSTHAAAVVAEQYAGLPFES